MVALPKLKSLNILLKEIDFTIIVYFIPRLMIDLDLLFPIYIYIVFSVIFKSYIRIFCIIKFDLNDQIPCHESFIFYTLKFFWNIYKTSKKALLEFHLAHVTRQITLKRFQLA